MNDLRWTPGQRRLFSMASGGAAPLHQEIIVDKNIVMLATDVFV